MPGELPLKVAPVPSVAELAKVALDVRLAVLMVGSAEESFCMRNSEIDAT